VGLIGPCWALMGLVGPHSLGNALGIGSREVLHPPVLTEISSSKFDMTYLDMDCASLSVRFTKEYLCSVYSIVVNIHIEITWVTRPVIIGRDQRFSSSVVEAISSLVDLKTIQMRLGDCYMLERMRSNSRILKVRYVIDTYIGESFIINQIIKSLVRKNASICLLGDQVIGFD
jgi:hypothetical protein